jgi:hypothetical protein
VAYLLPRILQRRPSMAEHDGEDPNLLERAAEKVKDAVTDPKLERALANQAAAMPAAGGDLNLAAGASPSSGPSAGFTPGAGAAAAGSLTDEEPVGKGDDPEYEHDR